jgi:hypothetical protein
MKIRRRNHPGQNGKKSNTASAPQGKRTFAGIMGAKSTTFYNREGKLIDTEEQQAYVKKRTEFHQALIKISGHKTWKELKYDLEAFIGAGPIGPSAVAPVFNDMMVARGVTKCDKKAVYALAL